MTRLPPFEIANRTAVAAGLLFLVAPLVMVVLNSIGPEELPVFPPAAVTLHAYGDIPERWLRALLHSLLLAAAVALVAAVLGTAAALALKRGRYRWRMLIDSVLRSPLQIPSLVLGIAFLQFYSWIYAGTAVDLRGGFVGLVLAHASVALPYVLTVVMARLTTFDDKMEEAAFGLGASTSETLRLVTLPVIAPATLSGAFFAFLLSLDNVPLSLFLVQGSFNLLPVDLFSAIQFDLTRTIYAVATLVCVSTTVIIIILYRWLTGSVAVSQM